MFVNRCDYNFIDLLTYYVLAVCSCVYSVVLDLGDFHFVLPTFLTAIFPDLNQICLQLQFSDFKKTLGCTVYESRRSSKKDCQTNFSSSANNFNKRETSSKTGFKKSNYTTMCFKSAVSGFDFYRTCWQLQETEILNCFHKPKNPFDMFTILVCQRETHK